MPPEETTPPVEITELTDGETPEVTEPTPPPDSSALEAELADTRKALKKANREAAERRKALEAFEKAEQERKQAEMSELEKAQATIAEMESRAKEAEAARDRMVKERGFYTAVQEAKLQFASEQARTDAIRLLDVSEMDDDEIADAVKDLQKSRPYLFSTAEVPNIDGQKRGQAKKGSDAEERIKAGAVKFGYQYVPPD